MIAKGKHHDRYHDQDQESHSTSNREWLREAWGTNERGESPSDNFLIRGTRFNRGVLLRHMLEEHKADVIGDPTQAHMVAIDARVSTAI